VPYRLPELIEAIANNHAVFICEGEKCADALRDIGVPATTNAMGAGKWKVELGKYLAGADVILVPDNDDAGYRHIQDAGTKLNGIAKRLRVLVLPGLPTKGDVCDWLAAGGTRQAFDRLADEAPEWRPLTEVTDKPDQKAKAAADEDALLEALANMSPGLEFARQRAKAAKELGVPRGAIDDELEARRSDHTKAAPLHGHWIVEPWPEVADGDGVHGEVATHSPILKITSAEPESGKTTTLGLISFIAPRCISSVEISEAALFRSIQKWDPSFVIDEFDSVLASEDKTALRSVINSGHTRGQGIIRCVEPDFTPQLFSTFCPKVIGMVGRKLPATTLSRCIIVELKRRKASEPIDRFEHKDDNDLAQLRSRLLRWSTDNEDALRDAKPTMPKAFDNRRADNWRVMLAIAGLAGEDWGDKARLAAIKLEGASDTTTIRARLLSDIRRIFDEDGVDCILSAVLVERLKADPEAPWVDWRRGKGLTQNSLATLLGGRICSETVHPSRDVHGKGYKRSRFEDDWARYLPAENPSSFPEGGVGSVQACKPACLLDK
jgi:hypothetical protein